MRKNAFFAFTVRPTVYDYTASLLLKTPVAYYLMLLYLFALCKPVMPLVQDMIAHTYFEHQHIAVSHQHGGSHVKEAIGKLSGKETGTTTTGARAFDSIPLHIASSAELCLLTTSSIRLSQSTYYGRKLSAIPIAIQLPPPRIVMKRCLMCS